MPSFALLLSLLGCQDYEFYNQKHTDIFQQNGRNQVDVLLVVDNSCSMFEEQDKLASNFDSFIQYFEGVDVEYQIAVTTTDTVQEQFSGKFVGGDDEIRLLSAAGSEIDRVDFDRDWGIPTGASFALDPDKATRTLNDLPGSWCAGAAAYGGGDLGTPGSENTACAAGLADTGSADTASEDTGSTTDTGGSETSAEAPKSGELIINEFMADPAAVADNLGEWVELKNTTDKALDLSGMHLSDAGRNDYIFPEGTTVAAGGFIVVARSADSAENGGIEGSLALGEAFTLNNQITIIDPETEGASEIFSEMVAQGTSGVGIEMGYEAARMSLSEPLISEDNAGFLREDANLSLIFVSDEDDDSGSPVDEYLRFFTDLKGESAYRNHTRFNISAVVGAYPPQFSGEPSCSSEDGVADYGKRYVDLANRTEGLVDSICDEDFSPIAADLGLVLSGLALEFELSENPNPETFEVELYETDSLDSFLRTLEEGSDWTYIAERNAIRFEEEQMPPPNSYISVSYELRARSATDAEDGTQDSGSAEGASQ
ncbi:MAG: lamin tail domain-containing protein [Myxococcota bacterium]|nr:lamin tail domain-containing protein [Myxococcota bacterium]